MMFKRESGVRPSVGKEISCHGLNRPSPIIPLSMKGLERNVPMLKKFSAIVVAVAAIALLSSVAHAGGLIVGDPAPKLTVKKFVKGAPVARFEKGKLYVVEFWATWCVPCRESIPHLTELAKKYKGVTFLGVSIWEDDQRLVEPFVTKMGAKMDYHIAMDAVPSGVDSHKGPMAQKWMEAAAQPGIPTAFIINKEGRVAWVGSPMAMADPLAKIVAGHWDIAAAAAKSRKEQAIAHKVRALENQIQPVIAKGSLQKSDYMKIVSLMNAAVAKSPEIEPQVAPHKIQMLELADRQDAAAAYITQLVDGAFKNSTGDLIRLALAEVAPDNPQPTPAILAAILKAVQRADVITKSQDPTIADFLASMYFINGKAPKAVETQERAIRLTKGTKYEKDPSFAERLAKYRSGK